MASSANQHKPWYFERFISVINCIGISTNYLARFQLNLCRTHRDMGKSVARIKKCPKRQIFRSAPSVLQLAVNILELVAPCSPSRLVLKLQPELWQHTRGQEKCLVISPRFCVGKSITRAAGMEPAIWALSTRVYSYIYDFFERYTYYLFDLLHSFPCYHSR
jgi:hypothetical protein